jgi:hypothetical protein
MERMRKSLLSLTALVLLIIPCIVQDTEAGTRFNATLRTPKVRVHVGNTSCGQCRSYGYKDYHVCKHQYCGITHRDRKIAKRLSWYTGVPARRLIRFKRYGYNWFEIGRRFRMPRYVVRAAMHKRSWKRFLYEERHLARRGARRRRQVVYFYGD